MPLYVYILKCSDGLYYTGVTNNIDRRFDEHQSGKNTNGFTYERRPVQLKYVESFDNYMLAIATEKRIKKWSAKKKEALIAANWEKLKELAQCRNWSHSKYIGLDSARPDTK